MQLFGFEISIRKALPNLSSVWSGGSVSSWWSPIREPFSGAWQKNITVDPPVNLLASSVVYACITGIAGDVSKLRIKLDRNNNGIWQEITDTHGNSDDAARLAVLRKPNHYQNRIKFVEQWIVSKLLAGNAYILKGRDDRRNVNALYVLDPKRVAPLVAENGDVYYQLQTDYLSGIEGNVTVPASEIIHDMMTSLWHPLVGVPPIYACAMSATMGNKIQSNATNLFGNASRPGGILTAPGHIADDTAARLKKAFEENFSGANVGRLAVLGDGLKFEPQIMTAEAAQQVEQLEWTVQDVGRAFHYPQWKLGGAMPPYSSGPEALTMMYYTDCLQPLIESFELCLDEGLGLPVGMGTELDIDNLLRMDTAALFESNNKGVGGGWLAPNEGRFRANYAPVSGGESPLIQQQNYSLAALAKRDAGPDPFASNSKQPPTEPQPKSIDVLTTEDIDFFESELLA